MPKIGRNDPCPCGSGKKYKQCHLPLEEAAQAEQLRLRRTLDTLLPKVIAAAEEQTEAIPAAFERFWDGKYELDRLPELDEIEGRGAERFLTWFAFDFAPDNGSTLVQRLVSGEIEVDLTDEERELLGVWAPVRLGAYVANEIHKAKSLRVADIVDGREIEITDHAASRRVELNEVLVAHLVPAGTTHFFAGAAAHLTEDTRDKLREFLALHLEAFGRDHPGAGYAELLAARSEILNHFVMQLPVEEPNPTMLENIIEQTRISLKLAGESLGFGRRDKEQEEEPAHEP